MNPLARSGAPIALHRRRDILGLIVLNMLVAGGILVIRARDQATPVTVDEATWSGAP